MQCTVTRPHLQNHRYRFLLTFIRAHQQMNTLNPNQLPHPPPTRYCLVCILHCQLKSKRRHMKEERERKGGGGERKERGIWREEGEERNSNRKDCCSAPCWNMLSPYKLPLPLRRVPTPGPCSRPISARSFYVSGGISGPWRWAVQDPC